MASHMLNMYFQLTYTFSVSVLVDKVANSNYTPETSWLCCEDYLKNTMVSCWQKQPKLRPDFNSLNTLLKPFTAIMYVYNMFSSISMVSFQ